MSGRRIQKAAFMLSPKNAHEFSSSHLRGELMTDGSFMNHEWLKEFSWLSGSTNRTFRRGAAETKRSRSLVPLQTYSIAFSSCYLLLRLHIRRMHVDFQFEQIVNSEDALSKVE